MAVLLFNKVRLDIARDLGIDADRIVVVPDGDTPHAYVIRVQGAITSGQWFAIAAGFTGRSPAHVTFRMEVSE